MTLTTMDSNSSTTTGNTSSNDDTSITTNAKNLDSLSEGGKKPPSNKKIPNSPRKKSESDMDSDSNDSGSLL